MKSMNKYDLSNKTFGRWTVLDEFTVNEKGARMWKCRCACGTERFVLAKSLKSGKSLSCGCLNKEIVKDRAEDLMGQIFGDLTVIKKAEPKPNQRDVYWVCKCVCGNTCVVSTYRLTKQIKTQCGCKTKRDHTKKDISNKRKGLLTALFETEKRDRNGSVVWHCKCDCGNEIDVSYDDLMYSSVISCGCKKTENSQKLNTFVNRVAGTSVDLLKSENKTPRSNSGVRGVYRMKDGRFRASITFQNVVYSLGTYKELESARKVRIRAEGQLHGCFLEFYEKWDKKAKNDPQWAQNNPVEVTVIRLEKDDFDLSFSPEIY